MGGCNSDDMADIPRKIESWSVIFRRRVRLLIRNDAGDEQTVNPSLRKIGTERNNENPIDAASAPAHCKPKMLFRKAGALHKRAVAFQES